ncbi:hypothetical protein E1B28_000161 [Marasmius oreades]|uniref:Uncharacterized protein n=1 Tax=Marasmius oreades TaxID=181124 RepID=A0A9P7V0U1_9AGAR|nr:uncharacterized protein E1B28_000161 [Marasmius oreades]KAG7098193.1 hypothetical protein E1B28_000161 [Marasmius oreades]
MATLSMNMLVLMLLNVVSFVEIFVPTQIKAAQPLPPAKTTSQVLNESFTASNDGNAIAIAICGGVGSLILYCGDFLLSGPGGASLTLFALTVFGTFVLLSLAGKYPRSSNIVKPPIAFGALPLRFQATPRPRTIWNFTSVSDNLPWPSKSSTYSPYSGSVLPAAAVAVDTAIMAVGTKVAVGLGLCATFEAEGVCREKFQQDLPAMSICYMGLLLVALFQDLLLGVLRPAWLYNVWHFVRQLKTPYAFMTLPIFFRLHHTYMWTDVVPRLTHAIDSLTLIIAGRYASDPLLAMDSTADFIVNSPFPARSVGSFIAALSLTMAPALRGYSKRYWALSGAGIGILVIPWDAVARPMTSLVVLGIVLALFSYLFKSIATVSGWSVLGCTIFVQTLIGFWSFLFCHSDDVRVSYSQGEFEMVQKAIAASRLMRDPHSKKGAPAHVETLTLAIDISSLIFTVGSFALVDMSDSFHEEVEYDNLSGHAFTVVDGNRHNDGVDGGSELQPPPRGNLDPGLKAIQCT